MGRQDMDNTRRRETNGEAKPLGKRPHPLRQRLCRLGDVLLPMAQIYAIQAVVALAVLLPLRLYTRETAGALYDRFPFLSLLLSLFCFILMLLVGGRFYRADHARFGAPRCHWRGGTVLLMALSVAAWGGIWNVALSAMRLDELFPYYQQVAEQTFVHQNPFLLAATTVIVGPAAEEMMFRGLVYRRIRGYLGPVWAALLSALLFGMYHGNMVQFVYASVLGVLLAAVYEKSGSLFASILAHGAANALSLYAEPLLTFLAPKGGAALSVYGALIAVLAVAGVVILLRRTPGK